MNFKIKEAARDRGITLAEISNELGVYRANLSAIASGSRGVSLKVLNKICHILDISLDELIEPEERRLFSGDGDLEAVLGNLEKRNYDGMDKSWVNRLMLARTTHYRRARRTA